MYAEKEGGHSDGEEEASDFNYMKSEEEGRQDEYAVQEFLNKTMNGSLPGVYCKMLMELVKHETPPLYIRV